MTWPKNHQPKPSAELWRRLEALKPRRNQRPLGSMDERVAALEKRILSKLKSNGDCLELPCAERSGGYTTLSLGGKLFRGHRFVWLFYMGEIAPGLEVCHTCDNRKCVNLDHLWLGTKTENMQDASRKGRTYRGGAGVPWVKVKTHCIRGHELFGDNITHHKNRKVCKACRKIREQKRRRK